MSENKKKSFCPLPWMHSYVGVFGRYQVCCIGDEYNNYIKDDQGHYLTVDSKPALSEVMNTKYMKDFRLKILGGELPPECTRCIISEKLGGTSRRLHELNANQDVIDDLIENTSEDGTISNPVTSIDYRFGNSCNLQCRMCGPHSSKPWIKDYDELPENLKRKSTTKSMPLFKKLNWQNQDTVLEEFKAKMKNTTRLHFAGGEALYVKNMEKMLQMCIDAGISKNIIVSYNTNLTILGDSLLEKWKSFKEIRLLVSIDGFGVLNDYIRYPSKWEVIDKFLTYLDKNHQAYNIGEILVSTTVQANNALHIDKLTDYLEKFEFVIPVPSLYMLYSPNYLSPRVLPKQLRMMASIKLKALYDFYQNKVPERYSYLLDNFKSIQREITVGLDNETELFSEFLEFTQIYDAKKNLSVLKINPELQNYLK